MEDIGVFVSSLIWIHEIILTDRWREDFIIDIVLHLKYPEFDSSC